MYQSEARPFKFIRDLVCANQAKLAQYAFLASQKHKVIRKIEGQITASRKHLDRASYKAYVEELRVSLIELDSYLNLEFESAFNENYEFIRQYFERRTPSNYKVRVSLKVIEENDLVISLTKRPHASFFLEDLSDKISKNSAFHEIADGNRHFIQNDIPKAISRGEYWNSRLDVGRCKDILQEKQDTNLSDEEWRKCWRQLRTVNEEKFILPPIQMCYRSTLVIPMSLSTSELRDEFIKKFKLEEDSDRVVIGFLCLDHPTTNFFKEEDDDVDFCYVIGDLLSLYLVPQFMYTNYSSIYQSAKTIIEQFETDLP